MEYNQVGSLLSDEQVGNLWRCHGGGDPMRHHQCLICDLIRKIVDERQLRIWTRDNIPASAAREKGLRELGIDPESF
jgi:hypothetical protein